MIEAERTLREAKTARLRALRLAKERKDAEVNQKAGSPKTRVGLDPKKRR